MLLPIIVSVDKLQTTDYAYIEDLEEYCLNPELFLRQFPVQHSNNVGLQVRSYVVFGRLLVVIMRAYC